eukprot:2163884-Amphidinium_carterae.1
MQLRATSWKDGQPSDTCIHQRKLVCADAASWLLAICALLCCVSAPLVRRSDMLVESAKAASIQAVHRP